MARTGTRAAQCPVPSLRLGFGTTRIGKLPELLDAGVVVGLGTDSPDFASTDLLRTVFLAATLYKDARQDTNLVPAEAALELATIRGAEAVGLAQDIGSITVGKKADLVLFDTDRPEWSPCSTPSTRWSTTPTAGAFTRFWSTDGPSSRPGSPPSPIRRPSCRGSSRPPSR